MEQRTFEEVDTVGRKASKLGLSPDNESAVPVLEEARRLHRSLANYQIGLVDVEMKKLTGSAKSDELSRLWVEAFTNFTNLGGALQKWAPINDALDAEITADLAAEKLAAGEAIEETKLDGIDAELKKMMDAGMPDKPAEEDEDDEEHQS